MSNAIEVSGGTIRIESSKLDPPSEQYDADYAWVADRNGAVSLFFAKGDAGRDGIVSRVEIRWSYEAFVSHFWASSRDFHASMLKMFKGSSLLARVTREHANPAKASPIKQHSLWASLDVIARNGSVAVLDFYDVSLTGFIQFGQTGDQSRLSVTPVLRVKTTVSEVMQLLDSSEAIVNELRPLIPPALLAKSGVENEK